MLEVGEPLLKQAQRKELIIQNTYEVCARNGLVPFSVKQVAKSSGVNEALIYRDFKTRENLLNECYKTAVHAHLDIFRTIVEKNECDEYLIWKTYINFMVEHRNETLFLMDYLEFNSACTHLKQSFYSDFGKLRTLYKKQTGSNVTPLGWDYALINSIRFSTWVLYGKVKKSEKSYKTYWGFLKTGFES